MGVGVGVDVGDRISVGVFEGIGVGVSVNFGTTVLVICGGAYTSSLLSTLEIFRG